MQKILTWLVEVGADGWEWGTVAQAWLLACGGERLPPTLRTGRGRTWRAYARELYPDS